MKHTLTEVDRAAKTAICAICGPTNIQVRPKGQRCGSRRRLDKANAQIRSYGITVAEWHAMLIAQSGRCDICLDPMINPCVDHDHSTGSIRALLCKGCNLTIGTAREDPAILRRAATYLELHR